MKGYWSHQTPEQEARGLHLRASLLILSNSCSTGHERTGDMVQPTIEDRSLPPRMARSTQVELAYKALAFMPSHACSPSCRCIITKPLAGRASAFANRWRAVLEIYSITIRVKRKGERPPCPSPKQGLAIPRLVLKPQGLLARIDERKAARTYV